MHKLQFLLQFDTDPVEFIQNLSTKMSSGRIRA